VLLLKILLLLVPEEVWCAIKVLISRLLADKEREDEEGKTEDEEGEREVEEEDEEVEEEAEEAEGAEGKGTALLELFDIRRMPGAGE
jgi:hypothetical protein